MIHHSTEGTVHVMQLDSTADLDTTRIARSGPNASWFRTHNYGTAENISWMGSTKHEVTTVLKEGWKEGTELVSRMAEDLRGQLEKPKSFKRRQRWMEDGDEPSWEREQAGRTEIWRTSRRDTMRGPTTVEIAGSWGGNAHQSAESLRWNGVVMVVVTDLLEEAGYRVGLTLNAPVRFYSGHFSVSQLIVKEPQNPLDIATLVPLVVHPGVFRWHGINLTSLVPFDCGSGHGSMINLSQLPPVSIISKKAVLLNNVYNEMSAKQEIQRVLDLFKDTSAVSTYIP